MFGKPAPEKLFTAALDNFAEHLPGLRDGEEVAIHQSRVAIRRLREAAALLRSQSDEDELANFEARLTKTFKALGRARDADTAQTLVQHVESRFPMARATLGQLRASATRSQLSARKRLIKTLEALEIDLLPMELARAYQRPRRFLSRGDAWRRTLRTHLVHRAADMRAAIDRAGGVYFRNRSHDARIAIKQFRYALELAVATGIWRDARALRTLRKAQDALGQAHDREVLLERAHQLESEGRSPDHEELFLLEQFLNGEINALHKKYLAARPEIVALCAASVESRHLPVRASAMAVAAIAIPAVLAHRRRSA